MQDPKIAKKSRSGHLCTSLLGYIFATKGHIDNWKKLVKHQYLPQMYSKYGEHRPNSRWDLLASLGLPCKFQRVSRLGSITARHCSSGRQPNFATLNRGRHLYPAGQPSCWALVMAALCSRCGHYIFALWFVSSSSIFFSSPNLSGRRLDVYHTSTHGVALVRI